VASVTKGGAYEVPAKKNKIKKRIFFLRLLTLEFKDIMLLKYYRLMRVMLSQDPRALELKNTESKGILS
jgi:hypothetical protein